MLGKITKIVQLISNMGLRYIVFRSGFEIKKRTGILKRKFPTNPPIKSFYTLADWKNQNQPFFFKNKEDVTFNQPLSEELDEAYQKLSNFCYTFFSSQEYELGPDYDWMTNPSNGYKYNSELHWLDINDYDPKVGDIKYVWEPSRFSHLYTIIRYDKHAGRDCSKQVFKEIERWLDHNQINKGPNFKCSQEISLRLMNWIFALYYYKNSPNLTETLFERIQYYIYWQVEHVYHNINFSRIAVRNNHAITETLFLYIAGSLFPNFPNAAKWKKKGKKWFEQEIAYQVYDDGSFLQFSMNYHRVVVQLLTWALNISALYEEKFDTVVYERAKHSLNFLMQHLNPESGWLPNYGNNDGALFFKLSDAHYRDFRPQLAALSNALGINWNFGQFEDNQWYGNKSSKDEKLNFKIGHSAFSKGGYYLYRTADSLSFIRCGSHKDRPAQADNLHLDIWYKDKNLLHDGGTYKYNSTEDELKYFMGTASHNTVMLGNYDQMEKGARFIWYHWTQCEFMTTEETSEYFLFKGEIRAFMHIESSIRHHRMVKIYKNEPRWEIEDHIINKPKDLELKQIWHTSYPDSLELKASLVSGEEVFLSTAKGYVSSFYGIKEECDTLIFSTLNDKLKTIITVKQ